MNTTATVYQGPSLRHMGDLRDGCACAYTYFHTEALTGTVKRPASRRRAAIAHQAPHVNVYESGTGQRVNRYLCQQRLTRRYPDLRPIPLKPAPSDWRALWGDVAQKAKALAAIVLGFLFPRINFGVGVTLWRDN